MAIYEGDPIPELVRELKMWRALAFILMAALALAMTGFLLQLFGVRV